MPKAYSYVRWSSHAQSQGSSLARQIEMAEKYANENGLELDTLSYRDTAVSALRGRNAESGALGLFLEAIREGIIKRGSFLLIEQFDRLSRQPAFDAFLVFSNIANAGIIIVTLQDRKRWALADLQSNQMLFMEWFFKASNAHDESKKKSDRSKHNQARKRLEARTKKMSSRCPAWMKSRPNHDTAFDLIPERVSIIQRIFEEAANGKGDQLIAVGLNADALATWGDNGRTPAICWHRSYVQKILNSEAVVGTLIQNTIEFEGDRKIQKQIGRVPNYYPAAVSAELWDRVRDVKATKSPARGRHASTPIQNIFGGLAKCALCGNAMTRVSKGKRDLIVRLLCTSVKNGTGCHAESTALDVLESKVEHALRVEAVSWLTDVGTRYGQYLDSGAVQSRINEIDRFAAMVASDPDLRSNDAMIAAVKSGMVSKRSLMETLRSHISDEPRVEFFVKRLRAIADMLKQETIDRGLINARLRSLFSAVHVDTSKCEMLFEYESGNSFNVAFEPIPTAERMRLNAVRQTRTAKGHFMKVGAGQT